MMKLLRKRINLEAAEAAYRLGLCGGRIHGPAELFLEVSARCQLRCRMCATTFDPRRSNKLNEKTGAGGAPFMTHATIDSLEPVLPGVIKAYLMGNGEPLLNPDFLDIAGRLTAHGIWTTFNTNGHLLDEKTARRLVEIGTGQVVFSIDSSDPDIYGSIRGADLERPVENLRRLARLKEAAAADRPHIMIAAVAMKSNIGSIPRLIRDAASWGAMEVHLEPLLSQDDPEYERFYESEVVKAEDLAGREDSLSDSILRTSRETGLTATSPLLNTRSGGKATENHQKSWKCAEPWTTMYISWDGRVSPCCQSETVLGVLGKKSVASTWRGKPYIRFREKIRRGPMPAGCGNCRRNRRERNDLPVLRELLRARLGVARTPGNCKRR